MPEDEIKVVRIPIGGRIGRGTRRLGFRLHHIVALGQIEERHAIIGTRGTLRLNDRVLVIEFVELKGGFRKPVGPTKEACTPPLAPVPLPAGVLLTLSLIS